MNDQRLPKSYKDHLVSLILGAYKRNFIEDKNEVEMVEQTFMANLVENGVFFQLQDSLKSRIYESWSHTVIGKVFERK